jgi:lipoprotein-anchoring transpeptidase ErfK/SrfK
MLLALIVTALAAASPSASDSVRAAAKAGSARPDTTLLTLPAPTIANPAQPAPVVAGPIRKVTTIATSSGPATVRMPETPQPTSVVRQAGSAVGTPDAKVSTPTKDVAALPASPPPAASAPAAAPPAAPKSTAAAVSTSAPAPVAPTPAPARDSAAIKPPVAAPADAVATASAEPRAAATTTRVDPRTVVSVRSSERFEPLYAVPIPSAGLRLAPPAAADSIVVYKRERTLVLYNRGVPIRTYFVALGSKPVGDKERAGDQKTPEGLFYVNAHNPASKFHLALRISYPDDAHRARAAALGADPGGDIMIHGLPKEYSEAGKNHLQNDWTNGCVALSNQEIEELWHAVPDGTPVHIKP